MVKDTAYYIVIRVKFILQKKTKKDLKFYG